MHWLWRAAPRDLKTATAEWWQASTGIELLRQAPWPEKALFPQLNQMGLQHKEWDSQTVLDCLPAWWDECWPLKRFQRRWVELFSVTKPSSLSNTVKKCIEARNVHGHYCMPKSLWALWEEERRTDVSKPTGISNETKWQSPLSISNTQPITSSWGVLTCVGWP